MFDRNAYRDQIASMPGPELHEETRQQIRAAGAELASPKRRTPSTADSQKVDLLYVESVGRGHGTYARAYADVVSEIKG